MKKHRSKISFIAFLALLVFLLGIFAGLGYQIAQPLTQAYAQPAPALVSAAITPQANATTLKKIVTELAEQHAHRNVDHLPQLEAAAQYIEAQLKLIGVQSESQIFQAEGAKYRNIIVKLGAESKEIIVLGAHYDVAGDQPGADDNASGVAGLLELIRMLKDQKLNRRVELVFYTNEEPPFFRTEHMGSTFHARHLKANAMDVKLMISLECIGYFSDAVGSQTYPLPLIDLYYPSQGNFIGLVGYFSDRHLSRQIKSLMMGATDLPVYSINAPSLLVGIDFSDHLNYHSEGYPAMMLTNTAFYRNKTYHAPQDTADRLDYLRMSKVVQAAYAVVIAKDQNLF